MEPFGAAAGSMPTTARKPGRARGELSVFPGKIKLVIRVLQAKLCVSGGGYSVSPTRSDRQFLL